MFRRVLHAFMVVTVLGVSLATTPGGNKVPACDTTARETGQQRGPEANRGATTLMSEADLADQAQGQSAPGAGQPDASARGQRPLSPDLPVGLGGWATYGDSTYGLSIRYPT